MIPINGHKVEAIDSDNQWQNDLIDLQLQEDIEIAQLTIVEAEEAKDNQYQDLLDQLF